MCAFNLCPHPKSHLKWERRPAKYSSHEHSETASAREGFAKSYLSRLFHVCTSEAAEFWLSNMGDSVPDLGGASAPDP